ncbi:MAG TPA: zinc-dependent metalloprotease family protein [Steroidobacteraceae bacterium]|jgi:hypothetical protein|nr:zinc-dependent metalloprotease family protein [Steroidobacteraceae bacterium]
MRAGKWVAVWLMAWALGAGAAVAAPSMQIKFAEAIQLPAVAGKAEFDAYGRRFALTLENNDRLLKAIPVARKADLGQARVLRGKVEGVPGSWVRLTRVGKNLEGAIWDGNDLYVVASYGSIVDKLTTPIVATPDQTVVYRLSDTLNGLPPDFCGLVGSAETGNTDGSALQQYKSLVSELRVSAATVNDQIDISLVADTAFQTLLGANATDAMLARLNIADGIFVEQVGVILAPTEFRLVPANADPFTKTDAGALLDQLAAFRQATPASHSAGLTHLMTGKNLDGNIIGIAFLDSLCDAHEGVSLGDSEEGEFMSALVMAHEIGHNFGARHDGVAGVCADTPQTYLMAPAINGSAQFSACSLTSMAASIANARGVCIGSAQYVDVAVSLPPSPYFAQTDGTFSLPITVHSYGNLPATNVRLKVTFPGYFPLVTATLTGATCSIAGGVVSCPLADFAAGEDRTLDMRVTGSTLGSYFVQAEVTTDNDRVLRNNTAQVQLGLQSGVDLGVTVVATPTAAFVTDAVDYTIDIASHGTLGSHGGNAYINIGGIPIESFNAGPHACALDASSNWILLCQLADVAVGASTRITVRGRPDQARVANGAVYLNVPNDATPNNSSATMSVNVSAEREVRLTASTEELRAVIGTTYELTYTFKAFGRLPAENVRFSLQQPPVGVVESVAIAGVTCATDPDFTNCEVGTMNPGDSRTAVVRFHMTSVFPSFMFASTRWSNGATNAFSSVYVSVYANVTVDASATMGSLLGSIDEGVTGLTGFVIETKGVNPAQNVTATLDLAAPLRLLSLKFDNGVPGWTCALLTPQRGRCTGSFPGGASYSQTHATMIYTFVSDTAVNGQATVTVEAAGDGNMTNNVAQASLLVAPYVDVGISAVPTPDRLVMTGDTTTVDATITTSKNPVHAARLIPWASDSPLVVDSLTVGGVNCPLIQPGSVCALGDLPANSSIPVKVVYRAVAGGATPTIVLDVYPDNDSDRTNNHVTIPVFTLDPSDVQVSVAQGSVTGINGANMDFPIITVTNGTKTSRDITVDIPLPSFVTVLSVSSSEIVCIGTTTLQCTLTALAPNNSRLIIIALHANATGTFTSNVVVHSFNDSNVNNNTGSIALTVSATAPPPPPPPPNGNGGGSSSSSSGGGGGGGRIEWLALVLLGGLVVRRMRADLRAGPDVPIHDTDRRQRRRDRRDRYRPGAVEHGRDHDAIAERPA